MPMQPGTTLGPYSVTAKIGEGGMGEVYQARDTKLDRDVALKVLPEAFTSDPDRLARVVGSRDGGRPQRSREESEWVDHAAVGRFVTASTTKVGGVDRSGYMIESSTPGSSVRARL